MLLCNRHICRRKRVREGCSFVQLPLLWIRVLITWCRTSEHSLSVSSSSSRVRSLGNLCWSRVEDGGCWSGAKDGRSCEKAGLSRVTDGCSRARIVRWPCCCSSWADSCLSLLLPVIHSCWNRWPGCSSHFSCTQGSGSDKSCCSELSSSCSSRWANSFLPS